MYIAKCMPGAGLEPARARTRGILSPLRLPIPPPGLTICHEPPGNNNRKECILQRPRFHSIVCYRYAAKRDRSRRPGRVPAPCGSSFYLPSLISSVRWPMLEGVPFCSTPPSPLSKLFIVFRASGRGFSNPLPQSRISGWLSSWE